MFSSALPDNSAVLFVQYDMTWPALVTSHYHSAELAFYSGTTPHGMDWHASTEIYQTTQPLVNVWRTVCAKRHLCFVLLFPLTSEMLFLCPLEKSKAKRDNLSLGRFRAIEFALIQIKLFAQLWSNSKILEWLYKTFKDAFSSYFKNVFRELQW